MNRTFIPCKLAPGCFPDERIAHLYCLQDGDLQVFVQKHVWNENPDGVYGTVIATQNGRRMIKIIGSEQNHFVIIHV